MKTVYENIVEKLYQEYSVHGFISENRIFEVLEENNISLLDSDSIVDKLLSRGVIIRDDAIPKSDEDDDEYDDGDDEYDDEQDDEYEDEDEEDDDAYEYETITIRRPKQSTMNKPRQKDDYLIDIDPRYFDN